MDWLSQHWLTTQSVASQLLPLPKSEPGGEGNERSSSDPQERMVVATIRELLEQLWITQLGDSYVISINFSSTDPDKAARIVNTLAELYVDGQREDKLEATRETAAWLTDRVVGLRREVLKSEGEVEQYRAANKMVNGQRMSLGEQELANLNLQLLSARAERAEQEARLRRVREVRDSGGSYESLGEVMSSPVIVKLREQEADLLREEAQRSREYGPRHPIMRELVAEKEKLIAKTEIEVGNIVANLANEVAVARTKEQVIAEALDDAKKRSAVTSQAAIQLREFEREAEANRNLYQTFLLRLKQTEEQLNVIRADAKVVSSADIPQAPSFPKPKLMIAFGFTASVMMGTFLAFLRDHLDSVFHTGGQLHEELGVATFGLVPSIRCSKRLPKPHCYLLEKPLSAYADAIRSVRKSMELSRPSGRSSQVVLVTSSLPDEGKTTLTLSLGASAARSGRRVVVVDLDLRHPSIAREIGQAIPGPGLVECLTGDATIDEIINIAKLQSNLHFIPIKEMTASPVDLLEAGAMTALLAQLRTRYDDIFMDGPPALVTDTRAAALLADTILYAVQWGKTKAGVAAHGLELLGESRFSVIGLVMTQVDLKRHAKYGYNDVAAYYQNSKKYYVE